VWSDVLLITSLTVIGGCYHFSAGGVLQMTDKLCNTIVAVFDNIAEDAFAPFLDDNQHRTQYHIVYKKTDRLTLFQRSRVAF
jgi:hypothetical protein